MVEKIKNARTKKVKLLMRNAQNAKWKKKQIDVAVYEGILSIFLVKALTWNGNVEYKKIKLDIA